MQRTHAINSIISILKQLYIIYNSTTPNWDPFDWHLTAVTRNILFRMIEYMYSFIHSVADGGNTAGEKCMWIDSQLNGWVRSLTFSPVKMDLCFTFAFVAAAPFAWYAQDLRTLCCRRKVWESAARHPHADRATSRGCVTLHWFHCSGPGGKMPFGSALISVTFHWFIWSQCSEAAVSADRC